MPVSMAQFAPTIKTDVRITTPTNPKRVKNGTERKADDMDEVSVDLLITAGDLLPTNGLTRFAM